MSILRKNKSKIKMGMSDRLLNTILTVVFSIFIVIILYPIIFVISSSFSSGNAVSTGRVILWPVEFSTIGYQLVFQHRAVWIGYANSIFYTVTATIINIIWIPIMNFAGTFDGQSHTISGLYVAGGDAMGLFQKVKAKGIVKNFRLSNAYLNSVTSGVKTFD